MESDAFPTVSRPWQQIQHKADLTWPIPMRERVRLALAHEPKASDSPDGFRLATCVVCERPMVAMWHLWVKHVTLEFSFVKEVHVCHRCATDIYGAPVPENT